MEELNELFEVEWTLPLLADALEYSLAQKGLDLDWCLDCGWINKSERGDIKSFLDLVTVIYSYSVGEPEEASPVEVSYLKKKLENTKDFKTKNIKIKPSSEVKYELNKPEEIKKDFEKSKENFAGNFDDIEEWVEKAITMVTMKLSADPKSKNSRNFWEGKVAHWNAMKGTNYVPADTMDWGASITAFINKKAIDDLKENNPELYNDLVSWMVPKFDVKHGTQYDGNFFDEKKRTLTSIAVLSTWLDQGRIQLGENPNALYRK